MAVSNNGLYALLVQRSGLSGVFAESAIRRACERAGVSVEQLSSRDLAKALPEIERALSIYLPADQVRRRMDDLRALS